MAPAISKNWEKELDSKLEKIQGTGAEMALANARMVRRVISGMGPDKNEPDSALGARVAVNIPAVHVPAFCSAPQGNKAYKNTYDQGKTKRLADIPPGDKIPARALVDDVLTSITNITADKIYFCAVELNGAGIRFYGDICFILKSVSDETVVLTSNSYDLIRPPITQEGSAPDQNALKKHVREMAGSWGIDTAYLVTLKAIATRSISERRLTTGQVSDCVLNDEDYLEVLKVDSFDATELQEARIFAADAAAETQIGEQLRLGPCPTLAELQWRKHRRAAVTALKHRGIHTRTITTSGRVR
jgi:hypothetical protein